MPVEIIHGSSAYTRRDRGPVVTIGNFDGVHRGHRALLDRARGLAGEGLVCAYTFDPAPRDVLRPNSGILRIQRLSDKLAALGAAGADQIVVEPFTAAFGANGPAWFAEEVLTRRLGAVGVVVGWDFRFGKGRSGDAAALAGLLAVPVEQVQAVQLDGEIVSSSVIRQATQRGEVDVAAHLLGRPHRVVGVVVTGDQRGRHLGFPTANVDPETPLLPADGVYAVRVVHDGTVHSGVCNLGTRPTFGVGKRQLEVHLLDYKGGLYGETLAVDFVARLRGEQAFAGVDDLKAQIARDVSAARAVLP